MVLTSAQLFTSKYMGQQSLYRGSYHEMYVCQGAIK